MRQSQFDLSSHIVSSIPHTVGLFQPLHHLLNLLFLCSKLLLELLLPSLHLGKATPLKSVVLKGAILIKPSCKTVAEIALDGMPPSVAIERQASRRNESRLGEVQEGDPRSIILQKRRRGGDVPVMSCPIPTTNMIFPLQL